jgi:hypothetical protein
LIDASTVGSVDMLANARIDPAPRWATYNPSVELVLPYPAGIAALRDIDDAIARGPLARYLPRGSSIAIVPATRGLPLSPFQADPSIVLAIRPEPPTAAEAHACEPPLRALADAAFAAGGRIYLASFALAASTLATQLADGARSLAALKASVDPAALCDRGNLHGWEPERYSPRMSQTLRSFEDLVAFLVKQDIPHQVDAANFAVQVSTTPPALPSAVFVRWEQKIPYVQLMQQLSGPVPDARLREVETALAHVNDVAMIAGYGYSYQAKVIYYRLSVPIYDGEISSDSLDRAMTAVLNNAVQLAPALVKVVEGSPGADVLAHLSGN